MKSPLKTTVIKNREDLAGWEDAWNELVEHRPMRSTAWQLGWWDVFQTPEKTLHVLIIEDAEDLVGIAPLYQIRVGSKSVLKLLGDSGDICTDHTTWYSRPGYAESVGESVADKLLESDEWGRLQFDAIDESEDAMAAAINKLKASGCLLHSTPQPSCWSLDLPETWDEYLAHLSKNHRKRCRRWVRNYFECGKVKLHTASVDDLDESWQIFLDMHRRRWGDAKRPDGSFSSPKFASFHHAISQHLASTDQLRLCYLTLDGQPIAGEYQLLSDDTLYSYQSGMSTEHEDVGPGNLSLVATIQYCLDNGIRRLDFLRGDEAYKAHWQAVPATRSDLRIWRAGINGQFEYGLRKARRIAADWLKR